MENTQSVEEISRQLTEKSVEIVQEFEQHKTDAPSPAQETAIVSTQPPPGPAELALPEESPFSILSKLDGFEDATITPSQLVIIQPTSRDENGTPGTFKDTVTGQSYREIKLVPLTIISKTPGMPRVLFQEGSALGSDPICRSNDGIAPAANSQAPQSKLCKGCKHSAWRTIGGKKKPPACREKAKILFIERETGLPYRITLGGRSVSPVKKVLETIIKYALSSVKQGIRATLHDFVTTMWLKRETDAKGTYYVVQFKDTARITNVGAYDELYNELVKARNALKAAEDEPTAGIEADVLGTPAPAGEQVHDAEVVDDSSDIPF